MRCDSHSFRTQTRNNAVPDGYLSITQPGKTALIWGGERRFGTRPARRSLRGLYKREKGGRFRPPFGEDWLPVRAVSSRAYWQCSWQRRTSQVRGQCFGTWQYFGTSQVAAVRQVAGYEHDRATLQVRATWQVLA